MNAADFERAYKDIDPEFVDWLASHYSLETLDSTSVTFAFAAFRAGRYAQAMAFVQQARELLTDETKDPDYN